MIISETIWAVAVALVAAMLVHEGGHLVCAMAAGQRPRVLMLGLGPTLMRLGGPDFVLVLRAVPITGYVLVEPTDRRWAYTLTVAGGPFASLLALIACLRAHVLWPHNDLLLALAIYQGLFLVRTLCPSHEKFAGLRLPSDGAQLYRLLRKKRTPPIRSSYAAVMASVEPPGAPARLPTRHAARLVFELARPDQHVEARARRDAYWSLRALLDEGDLTSPERAFILCFLCAIQFIYDEGLATGVELDLWSQQALTLTRQPLGLDTRGAVLLLQGRRSEAEAFLREALDGYVEFNGTESIQAALCRAVLARTVGLSGRDREAQELWRQGEAASAMTADPRRRMMLTRIKARALPTEDGSPRSSAPAPAL